METKIKKKMALKQQTKFSMTITKELFEAWQKLRRRGDTEQLMAILGKSRPSIDRALNFGHVLDTSISVAITKFYQERKESEQQQAKELLKK